MTMGADPRRVAVALDVGGTKIAAGLVDGVGRVLSSRTAATGSPGAGSLQRAAALGDEVASAARDRDLRIAGTGIGLPELVENGRITSTAVVGWNDKDTQAAFAHHGPVRVEADIRTAALAEARLGNGSDSSVFLYLNLGTGISHCLVIDGRPFQGQFGRALMCGSTRFTVLDESSNRLVGCCVEDSASGRGISERYARITGLTLTAPEVFEQARAGDPDARLVVDQAIDLIGHMVASLIDILDPGRVIVGGGLAGAPGLLERMSAVTLGAVWSDRARSTPIEPTMCGPQAGLIGAGLTLLDQIDES